MSNQPFISICIPAYKRVAYLKKLLDSIAVQTFKDFEVVVSDDSNDNSVAILLDDYKALFRIVYRKNETALGTPANWNAAIGMASGEWIKLMHDDDWFAADHALQRFATAAEKGNRLLFCSYHKYHLRTGHAQLQQPSAAALRRIKKDPRVLYAGNLIGPPSVTLVHRSVGVWYDERMKWLVDLDYYISVLQQVPFLFIGESLVNIGLGEEQVTVSAFRNPVIEIPEAGLLLQKQGIGMLRNIWVYDAWWRLMRNLHIGKVSALKEVGYEGEIPGVIARIVQVQSHIPVFFLKTGFLSKILMFFSYWSNRPGA